MLGAVLPPISGFPSILYNGEDMSETEEAVAHVKMELDKARKHQILLNLFSVLAGFLLGFAVALILL